MSGAERTTVTVEGQRASQARYCEPGEVQTHRIEYERLARRALLRSAEQQGLDVAPGSIRVCWRLEVEGTAYPIPEGMKAEIGELEIEAQRLELAGLTRAAHETRRQAEDVRGTWLAALDRAYEDHRPLFFSAKDGVSQVVIEP